MVYPSSLSDFTAFHTAALVQPSSPAIRSPEITSPLYFSNISSNLDFTVIFSPLPILCILGVFIPRVHYFMSEYYI